MHSILAFILYLLANSSYQEAARLDQRQMLCVATAVYHESRGEPITGQAAVAWVIKNRVQGSRYPGTACGVVYQPYQFTDIKSARPDYNSPEWKQAVEVAILVWLDAISDPTNGAMYYYAHEKIDKPRWAYSMVRTVRLYNHTFYREPVNPGSIEYLIAMN